MPRERERERERETEIERDREREREREREGKRRREFPCQVSFPLLGSILHYAYEAQEHVIKLIIRLPISLDQWPRPQSVVINFFLEKPQGSMKKKKSRFNFTPNFFSLEYLSKWIFFRFFSTPMHEYIGKNGEQMKEGPGESLHLFLSLSRFSTLSPKV